MSFLSQKLKIFNPLLLTLVSATSTMVVTLTFLAFNEVSENEIRRLILKSSDKSCNLDPIPNSILKDCVYELAPTLTGILNFPFVWHGFLIV